MSLYCGQWYTIITFKLIEILSSEPVSGPTHKVNLPASSKETFQFNSFLNLIRYFMKVTLEAQVKDECKSSY